MLFTSSSRIFLGLRQPRLLHHLRPPHVLFQRRRTTHSSSHPRAAAPPPPRRAARALLLLAAAAPLTALALIVAGTSYGKVYRPEDAPRFLLRAASLDPATLRALRDEALRVVAAGACARYNFPPGKAGSAVSYAELRRQSPQLCAFYEGLAATVSDLLGVPVAPTPREDNSSLSLLLYAAEGDHIDWHYDVNFYRGRHFTVLVPLVVSGPVDAQLQVVAPHGAQLPAPPPGAPPPPAPVRHASASQETVRALLGGGRVEGSGNAFEGAAVAVVPTLPGRLVAFEGQHVFHRVTPLGAGARPWPSSWEPPPPPPSGTVEGALEARLADAAAPPVRLVLSMTYATDARANPVARLTRTLKDLVYFGPLGMWRE